jgi:hypothetical protein
MSGRQWAQRIEIVASLSVILTLVFLILEVRGNTSAIERPITLDRWVSVTDVFINNSDLAETYVKIKAVDGVEPLVQAFIDRYALSAEESVRWTRGLMRVWGGLHADYLYSGPSQSLERQVRGLLSFPDNELFWRYWIAPGGLGDDFNSYVAGGRAAAYPERSEGATSENP